MEERGGNILTTAQTAQTLTLLVTGGVAFRDRYNGTGKMQTSKLSRRGGRAPTVGAHGGNF